MLIAEDLLLLLTDDRTGKLAVPSTHADVALGGAMLVELALAKRVDVAGPSEAAREGRLVVRDATPTGDELLDEALARLGEKKGPKPKDAVSRLGKGLRDRLHARLVGRGLLREENGRILGIFPTHRWPAVDAVHEQSVRAQLEESLRRGVAGDGRTGALVSLLHALKAVDKAVDAGEAGLTKKELRARAGRIAEGDWASQAVRKAIDELTAALVAATSGAVASGNP